MLVGEAGNVGGYSCVVVGGYRKSLYFPLNFAMNRKLLYKES